LIRNIFISLIILPLLLAGCSSANNNKDILIGVAWPLASNNSLFKEGVELAVNEINQNGGIKSKKLEIIMNDDEASVAKGMAVAQSYAENKDMVAVIGHRNSSISIPASRIYEDAGLVMLSPASTAPELTEQGYNFIFRNIPSDDEITRQLAIFAAHSGHKRMVIYYSDDSYGRGLANSFEDHAGKDGVYIVDRFSYYGKLTDLERLHQKWKALDFDGVFIAQALPGGAEFIAEAGQAGITVPFIGGNALDSPMLYDIAGKYAEGTVIGTIFNPLESRPEVESFIKSFKQKYNQSPTAYSAQGYDAVKLLAAAIEKSNSTNPSVIADQLRKLNNYPGVAGYHTFNDNGDDIGKLVIKKVFRNGRFEYMD
jgi:branched-chain amino acid transport system substrate-binding protein